MIYLDHAATSWPKPPEVTQAMIDFLERAGGNPGRSGHRLSIEAGRIVYAAREAVAELFNVFDPLRIIFTLNATHAINLVLHGLLHSGDHVVTTSMEHNAVMRPLRALEAAGVQLTVVPCASDGTLDLGQIERAITSSTRLVIVNHASNVCGMLQPIEEVTTIARHHGARVLIDAAQTAGVIPIDLQATPLDFLAFTGHKGLYGPPGTGGLIINDQVDTHLLEPVVRGGTGSRSEFEKQPNDLPDKYESGTPNGVGLAGLGAGVRWVQARGIDAIRAHEQELAQLLNEGLRAIAGVNVHGPVEVDRSTGVVSFTVAGKRVSEVGGRLDEEFGVLCRVGLHCAPAAHRTLGTFPEGTVRFAPGVLTTREEIQTAVHAVEVIAR
ncbi:cysteine desulfurase / selenocysteine lyase [Thermoflexales bacterium]|nr:cysteine desulfurase / selenocysteine lyase [Thermoflexales bacterium]